MRGGVHTCAGFKFVGGRVSIPIDPNPTFLFCAQQVRVVVLAAAPPDQLFQGPGKVDGGDLELAESLAFERATSLGPISAGSKPWQQPETGGACARECPKRARSRNHARTRTFSQA